MADIDSIISGVNGNTRADFSGLFSGPIDAYNSGQDQKQKRLEREVFKEGLPTNADGSPNYGEMANQFYKIGNVEKANTLSNLDIQRQQLRLGQDASQALGNLESGGRGAPIQTPIVKPSTARNGVAQSAPAANVARPEGQGQPTGDRPGSIVGLVSDAGIPDELAGPIIQQVSAMSKTDPNAPINPQIAPRVAQIVQQHAMRLKGGQGGPQQQPQQPSAEAPQVVDTRGSAPTTIDPNIQQRAAQYTQIMSNPALPESVRNAAKMRLEALQTNSALTKTQKEYQQAVREGFKGTLEDWENRSDDNTTQRDILTKSLLPKVDKSQETAMAARDDINAIHRSREELDQKGGVFSGAFADKKLYLAKVAEVLGVPNSDKITNTEAYGAAIGSRVASMVKAFGSGTAISDGDRKFAANMAGGQITLDETSMRRILDIGERAARGKIDNHNKLVDDVVGSNDALKKGREAYIVGAPDSYKKPEQRKSESASTSGTAVSSKSDYDKLPSGAKFTGPDGRPWQKP